MLELVKADVYPSLGSYLYVKQGGRYAWKAKATLVSHKMRGTKCISFAYCMNGKNVGTLDVFVKTSQGQWHNFAFYKKRHQGKGWQQAELSLRLPGSFQVRVFEIIYIQPGE